MVLAPGSASERHHFCVVCVRVALVVLCGGCGVSVGVWGCGPLVVPCVRALFVGGSGCAWVGCPRGVSSTHPGHRVLGLCRCLRRVLWLPTVAMVCCSTVLCVALCCPCTRVLLWCVLHCAAPLCTSTSFVCLGVALSCAALVCDVRLCSVVCLCRL